ncbi:MAG: hypothetical protein GXP27_15110 [Planctomycetes bacterium]|nr:hypothetical protein [Planctomycetota bacterium]
MRSRAVSPVGTLLTIVAVLAVPLLAIFGIPQFMPVVASPSVTGDTLSEVAAPSPAGSSRPLSARDIFAPVETPVASPADNSCSQTAMLGQITPASRLGGSRLQSGWTAPAPPATSAVRSGLSSSAPRPGKTSQALATHAAELAGPPAVEPAAGTDSRRPVGPTKTLGSPRRSEFSPHTAHDSSDRTRPVSSSVRRPAVLTWKQAIQQLNALGIRRYRLQPGRRIDTFHFCCYVHPTTDPRVAVRFESEAEDPLQAVRQVLAQVTEWYRNQ